ncbi:S8 family serine peptidase [Eggerthella guodeyinii]|uniref:S8 family serine peptidase n=1 Tax=Eggerthella guodeyinii TaxID=2690837 RepID=A0A6N7RN79_9ACTN|nr:S8 family serine peptidase [Eggerthella guodeyinii]MRX82280.1 S8 family serine peptidase [Eggerthella guodeyinii]
MPIRPARLLFDRFAAALCALALALGLVPLAPAAAVAEERDDAPAEASVEELLGAGAYLEGEALVVYRSNEGSSRSRSLDAADPLAAAGFSVGESWDFAGADDTSGANALALDEDVPQDDAAVVARVTKPGADTAALLEELRAMDGVLAAAPNYVHESVGAVEPAERGAGPASDSLFAPAGEAEASGQPVVEGTGVLSVNGSVAAVTDDPLSALQWALDNDIESDAGDPADSDVDFSAVYELAAAGEENIVAVLDSGVDYNNEDLREAMWENPGDLPGVSGRAGTHGFDFVDGDDEPLPESDSLEESHGTHCAGVIAATSGNGTGVAGVSPNTKIMAFRTNGASTGGNVNDGAVLSSYEFLLHAKLAGENVVAASNSWSGVISPVTEYAINQAGRAGVLTVFSAGNDDADAGSIADGHITYGLSDSPYILSVAASSPLGTYATYTNYNETIVDVTAPGSTILSTVAEGAQTYLPAVAKLQDNADGAPGTRSLYYHNMVDFSQVDSGAGILLYGAEGKPAADQNRLSVATGVGLDGRQALKLMVNDMTSSESVTITWRIDNPFKNMTWEHAENVCVSALPGVSAGDGIADDSLWALPLLLTDDGYAITDAAYSGGSQDNQSLASAHLKNRESFESVKDQDTLRVGVDLSLSLGASTENSVSFTVTDFGMGYASSDQAYDYMSGTSMACPLVAGAVGLLASLYPDETALDLRGRIVGGTKASNFASDPVKQTSSNGTLDLAVAAGVAADDAVHPNTWGAHEGEGASGGAALVLEGYALKEATQLSIDGAAVDAALWEADPDGSELVVRDAGLLDGARHVVEVEDGTAVHKAVYAFPKTDQRLSFERVIDLPDPVITGEVGFDSGMLIAAADRLFCIDSKGRYLYAYDPESADGWTACASPSDAGFDLSYFRANSAAAYADGKLYMTVFHDEETDDPENPYTLSMGVVTYDIATDTWDGEVLDFIQSVPGAAGRHFPSPSLASLKGCIYFSIGSGEDRTIVQYDPATGDGALIDFEEADPQGSFGTLASGRTAPLAAVGDELRFVGFVPEGDGYAMTLGTFDGETFGVLEPGADAPRFGADELDALEGYARQASAATGDEIVFAGASADVLGDAYAVDAATGAWRALDAKAPGDGSAAVSTACFYRGTYYVLAASTSADGAPTTALYRLPDGAALAPNDHVASARATEGGTVDVRYGAVSAARVAASSQVEHVALGDTVTWIATPDEGYAFSGWYGADGSLISEDASYRQPVTADIALSARFVATSGPATGPDPAPDDGLDPKPLPSTVAKPLAPTGDGLGAARALAAATAAAGLVAALGALRLRKSRR